MTRRPWLTMKARRADIQGGNATANQHSDAVIGVGARAPCGFAGAGSITGLKLKQ